MNLSRLMILGVPAERGPLHDHQIRRAGELANAEVWGGISSGALYSEPRKLAGDAFRRGELRLEAELRSHEEFETKLALGAGGPRA